MVELETSTVAPESTLANFEDILNLIGGWSRYQKTVLAIFFVNCMFLAYAAYTPVLFLYTPDHHCSVDHIWNASGSGELDWDKEEVINILIPMDNSTGKRNTCFMYDISIDTVRSHLLHYAMAWNSLKILKKCIWFLTIPFQNIPLKVKKQRSYLKGGAPEKKIVFTVDWFEYHGRGVSNGNAQC